MNVAYFISPEVVLPNMAHEATNGIVTKVQFTFFTVRSFARVTGKVTFTQKSVWKNQVMDEGEANLNFKLQTNLPLACRSMLVSGSESFRGFKKLNPLELRS